jgi:hypothetical protein
MYMQSVNIYTCVCVCVCVCVHEKIRPSALGQLEVSVTMRKDTVRWGEPKDFPPQSNPWSPQSTRDLLTPREATAEPEALPHPPS